MLSKRILIVLALAFLTLLVGCLTPTNQTPILTSDPITVATVGVEYTYNVNATDPDGDTLTYSFIDRPEGMVINSTTGVINWIPSFGQIGDNPVIVKVSDGSLSIAQSFIIEVSKFSVNQAPIIYPVPITTATVGETYVYDVEATDPDGDTLTYSLITKPAGMTINSVTGLIWWTPTSTQIGDNLITVKVTDGVLSDTQGFTITVSKPTPTPVNQKPVINSYPITTAIVGETYTYTIYAFDPDGDILTYSIIDVKPIGMTINPANGFIWWTPTSTQIGDNLITVKVTDGVLSDTQSFIVKVSEPETEPELTEIIVDPKVMDLIVGGFETFEVTAYYDNDTTNIVTFKCLYGTSNSSIAYVAYGIDKVITLAVGTATIFISYTQYNFLTGEEITKTDEIDVTVTGVPMDIIADLPTFTLDVPKEFTIEVVANSDVDKTVMFYFTLPTLPPYDYTLELFYDNDWIVLNDEGYPFYDSLTGEVVLGGANGDPLIDEILTFKGTFTTAGTYETTVEVWTVTGTYPTETKVKKLYSGDISAVVE